MPPKSKRFKPDLLESPIAKLSDDVLLQVLELLDGKSMKNAALVCRNWNKIISSSVATMKKLELQLEASTAARARQTQRNHVNLWAYFPRTGKSRRLVEAVEKFQPHLEKLTLTNPTYTIDSLGRNLQSLPMLQSLNLMGVCVNGKLEQMQFIMPQLTDLEFTEIDFRILSLLPAHQLKNLKIGECRRFEVSSFTNFLRAANNLKFLVCESTWICQSSETFEGNFPFKLKAWHDTIDDVDLDSLPNVVYNNFLLSQSSSLEEIDLTCKSEESFKIVFTKLPNLKVWSNANLENLPNSKPFYAHMKPTKIKEISSSFDFKNKRTAQEVLRNCPDLEVLKTDGKIVPALLNFLAIHNPKLKSLDIRSIGRGDAHIPSLKSLSISFEGCRDGPQLASFLSRNPAVENFTLSIFDESIWEEDGEMIIENDTDYSFLNDFNIKHLTLRGETKHLKRVYDHIKKIPRTINTLDLEVVFDEREFNLKFEFPEDRTKWSRHCELFDRGALKEKS